MSEFFPQLGLRYNLLQAPMAGVATPQLAAAVSEAGGLGGLGMGASTPVQASQQLQAYRALTRKPLNINLFCHQPPQADAQREADWLAWLQPHFQALGAQAPANLRSPYQSFLEGNDWLQWALDERPEVLSFHFGLPSAEAINQLKAAGILLLGCATRVSEAQAIVDAQLDGVIVQGVEAGGHRGCFNPAQGDSALTTADLLGLCHERFDLPLIAAGGIMTGADWRAMEQRGASAVQLGTAFIACPESAASAAYRHALQTAECTAITASISGRAARGLHNGFHELIDSPNAPARPDYPICYDAGKALAAAASAQGNSAFNAFWAGTGFKQQRGEMPASQVLAQLVGEYKSAQ